MNYPPPRQLVRELNKIVSQQQIWHGRSVPARYFRDGLRAYRAYHRFPKSGFAPSLVIRPETTKELSLIVKTARSFRYPLVPFGGGTGLMGGAVASSGGIVLDMKGFGNIKEINIDDRTAIVGAGVVLEDLETELNHIGLRLGHDPWSRPRATVGGAISTNGLGYFGARYGTMGDQVLGIEAVLGNNIVVKTRAAERSSTGPLLRNLLIGSEGTLGLITEATLRVFQQPEHSEMISFQFAGFEEGFRALQSIYAAGLRPSVLDFGGDERVGRRQKSSEAPNALLYILLEGITEEVRAMKKRIVKLVSPFGGRLLAEEYGREYWELRHEVVYRYDIDEKGFSLTDQRRKGSTFDFVHVYLPASKVLSYKRSCENILRRHKIQECEFGVWNQPELFSVAIRLPSARHSDTENMAGAIDEMLLLAQEAGGSMEYCHGAGIKLAHLLPKEHGQSLVVLKTLKDVFDPDHILNPGKLGL